MGTTRVNVRRARAACSNWPVHSTKTPSGSLASSATASRASADQVGGVAVADVHPYVIAQESVFALDRGGTLDDLDVGDLGQGDLPGLGGVRQPTCPEAARSHRQVPDRLFVFAPGPAVADDDRVPLAALDGRRDDLAGQGRLDHVVDLADAHAQPGGPVAVEADLDVRLAADRVGDDVDRASQWLHDPGDFFRAADDVVEVAAQHADADRRVDARGKHVDPILDRHRPDVRPARHLDAPCRARRRTPPARRARLSRARAGG